MYYFYFIPNERLSISYLFTVIQWSERIAYISAFEYEQMDKADIFPIQSWCEICSIA